MRISAGMFLALFLVFAGCHGGAGEASDDPKDADTRLVAGQVTARSPGTGIWRSGDEWRVVETFRIGSAEGEVPDVFGSIFSLAVDPEERVWVLDGQAQQVRVFDAGGAHVRTVGGRGSGPGELSQAVHVEVGPDGEVWVTDPGNVRISVFDTTGAYRRAMRLPGACFEIPWPGGLDGKGNYYAPAPPGCEAVIRHDSDHVPRDTLQSPRDLRAREAFVHRTPGGGVIEAEVPFQGGTVWRLSDRGTLWALVTDHYLLYELNDHGDTLRTVSGEFTLSRVTEDDLRHIRGELEWFTEQGGRIDESKMPSVKPPAVSFFLDDEENIWVERFSDFEDMGHSFDIFDSSGRFFGGVRMPFSLSRFPSPIVRNGRLFGVTEDSLGVEYVVVAQVVKP